MNIGIDIDGVMTDYVEYMLDTGVKYCRENGIEYKIDLTKYDESKMFGISDDEVLEYLNIYFTNYVKNARLKPSCKEVIDELKTSHKIYIITSRNDYGIKENSEDVQKDDNAGLEYNCSETEDECDCSENEDKYNCSETEDKCDCNETEGECDRLENDSSENRKNDCEIEKNQVDKIVKLTKEWLSKNEIVYDEIYFSADKSQICNELNIDVMIEDSPMQIKNFDANIKVLCMDYEYNKDIDGPNVIRVYSWQDILTKLNTI